MVGMRLVLSLPLFFLTIVLISTYLFFFFEQIDHHPDDVLTAGFTLFIFFTFSLLFVTLLLFYYYFLFDSEFLFPGPGIVYFYLCAGILIGFFCYLFDYFTSSLFSTNPYCLFWKDQKFDYLLPRIIEHYSTSIGLGMIPCFLLFGLFAKSIEDLFPGRLVGSLCVLGLIALYYCFLNPVANTLAGIGYYGLLALCYSVSRNLWVPYGATIGLCILFPFWEFSENKPSPRGFFLGLLVISMWIFYLGYSFKWAKRP